MAELSTTATDGDRFALLVLVGHGAGHSQTNRTCFMEDRTTMVTIVSDTGEELATAMLRKGSDDLTLAVERVVHGKGRLFGYYFSQGRRSVLIESGDFRLNGTITTEWAGAERLWKVRLLHPAELEQASDGTAQYPRPTPA